MATRADFWLGDEWLGSVAHDGNPDGIGSNGFDFDVQDNLTQTAEEVYQERVAAFLAAQSGILPERGWPWPWEDSATSDYAYGYFDGAVWASSFGGKWFKVQRHLDCYGEPRSECDDYDDPDAYRKVVGKVPDFPNMKDRKGPLHHGGMIVLTTRGNTDEGRELG